MTANPKAVPAASPLSLLAEMLDADMDRVNNMIVQRMDSRVPMVSQLAGYLIAAGGKRIRPLLTLAATSLCDGDMARAHRLATAVEFIHTATLLHDDVVDDSDQRRGQESANVIFGNEASVLVGDFLFSRAFQLMTEDGSLRVLKTLADASATIAEGEVFQLSIQGNLDASMEDYLTVIHGKTAALFAAACEVGPLIAETSEDHIAALREYGMNLGMAFQIADDVLDYSKHQATLGKNVGDDFHEGKMSAPVIMAYAKADEIEKKFWQRTIAQKDQNEGDLVTAQAILARHQILENGLALANDYGNKAKAALGNIADSPLRRCLIELVDFSIRRTH